MALRVRRRRLRGLSCADKLMGPASARCIPTPHRKVDPPMAQSTATRSLCDHLLEVHQPAPGAGVAVQREVSLALQAVQREMLPIARSLARSFHRDGLEPFDLVQQGLLRLTRAGPLRGRADAPADDASAGRYLYAVLKRLAIDHSRRKRVDPLAHSALIQPGDADRAPLDPADPMPNASERLAEAETLAEHSGAIAAADARLDAVIYEACQAREASRRGSGQALAATLSQLRAAAEGALDIGLLAAHELRVAGGDPDDPVDLARARNAIDARFKRARQAAQEALDRHAVADSSSSALEDRRLLELRLHRRTSVQGHGQASEPPAPRRRLPEPPSVRPGGSDV